MTTFESSSELGVAVLVVDGEIDVSNADAFRGHLIKAAWSTDPPAVIVDMSAVTFIDSGGVEALIDAHRHIGGGKAIRLRKPHIRVSRVLDIIQPNLIPPEIGPGAQKPAPRPAARRTRWSRRRDAALALIQQRRRALTVRPDELTGVRAIAARHRAGSTSHP